MPQQHKGDRAYTPARVHRELRALLDDEAAQRSVPRGDVINDLLAAHYGRPDLSVLTTTRDEQLTLPHP